MEFSLDGLLDHGVGVVVHGTRRLVQQEDLRLADECAGQTEQLLLADGEIVPVLLDYVVQLPWQGLDQVVELRLVQSRPELVVGVGVVRIDVHPTEREDEKGVIIREGEVVT